MANSTDITLHESGAESASGDGDAVDISAARNAVFLTLRVTAFTGTNPTLVCEVQTSTDGSSDWRTISKSKTVTKVCKVKLSSLGVDQFVRVIWTIGGTASPSFTFSVDGSAHTVFATRDDITNGELTETAIADVDDAVIAEALIDGSCDAEDALAASNALPLTAWPNSLSRRVAALAAFQIMKARGFKPTGFDELIVDARDRAEKWLKDVAAGKIRPPGLAPATQLGPQTSSGNPAAPTRYKRRMSDNWGDFG